MSHPISLIHQLSKGNSIPIIEYFLDSQAEIKTQLFKETAWTYDLMRQFNYQNKHKSQFIDLLLKHGYDFSLLCSLENKYLKFNPAQSVKDIPVAFVLIEQLHDEDCLKIYRWLHEHNPDILFYAQEKGILPLNHAYYHKHIESAKFLHSLHIFPLDSKFPHHLTLSSMAQSSPQLMELLAQYKNIDSFDSLLHWFRRQQYSLKTNDSRDYQMNNFFNTYGESFNSVQQHLLAANSYLTKNHHFFNVSLRLFDLKIPKETNKEEIIHPVALWTHAHLYPSNYMINQFLKKEVKFTDFCPTRQATFFNVFLKSQSTPGLDSQKLWQMFDKNLPQLIKESQESIQPHIFNCIEATLEKGKLTINEAPRKEILPLLPQNKNKQSDPQLKLSHHVNIQKEHTYFSLFNLESYEHKTLYYLLQKYISQEVLVPSHLASTSYSDLVNEESKKLKKLETILAKTWFAPSFYTQEHIELAHQYAIEKKNRPYSSHENNLNNTTTIDDKNQDPLVKIIQQDIFSTPTQENIPLEFDESSLQETIQDIEKNKQPAFLSNIAYQLSQDPIFLIHLQHHLSNHPSLLHLKSGHDDQGKNIVQQYLGVFNFLEKDATEHQRTLPERKFASEIFQLLQYNLNKQYINYLNKNNPSSNHEFLYQCMNYCISDKRLNWESLAEQILELNKSSNEYNAEILNHLYQQSMSGILNNKQESQKKLKV